MARRSFIIAVVASVLLHVLMFLVLGYLQELSFPSDKASAIEVFLQKPDGGWQIADIPKPLDEQKPESSKFLGMYNQSTREETVANNVGRGTPARQSSSGGKDKGVVAKLALPNGASARGGSAFGGSSATTNLYKFDKDLFAMRSAIEKESTEISTGAPEGSQATVPEDFYPDFKYGEHTYINVLRYPDVEYFVRLKRIFKTTWDPVPALQREMPSISVSRGMVSVVLAVSVDKAGQLSELFVLRSSGLGGYDNEAIRTVRASSPFASPPEKFLEDGALRMSWTFVVYL